MKDLRGVLQFFTFVAIKAGDGLKHKRVGLGSIYCSFEESKSKLEEFKHDNADVFNPRNVHADFTFREYVD